MTPIKDLPLGTQRVSRSLVYVCFYILLTLRFFFSGRSLVYVYFLYKDLTGPAIYILGKTLYMPKQALYIVYLRWRDSFSAWSHDDRSYLLWKQI